MHRQGMLDNNAVCGMCAVAFCKGVILCNLIFAPIHGSSKSEINVTYVHSTEDDNESEVNCLTKS